MSSSCSHTRRFAGMLVGLLLLVLTPFTDALADDLTKALAPVSPENNATGVAIPVNIAWNAPGTTATYRYWLQVSRNDKFTELAFGSDGITVTSASVSTLVANTKYWWRVKLAGTSNTAQPWSPARNFTTKAAPAPTTAPAIPLLYNPADKAVDVATTALLAWNPAERVATYTVQVAKNDGFTEGLITKEGVTGNTLALSQPPTTTGGTPIPLLSPGTKYFWRVKAVNASGASGWSAVWCFTTKGTVAKPGTPVLASPANGATEQPVALKLSWNAAERATRYMVQVSLNKNFSSFVVSKSADGLLLDISGLAPSTTYYWRVQGFSGGGEGPLSAVWSFTTKASTAVAPSMPRLYAPMDKSLDVPVIPTLGWYATERASSYAVQIAKNDGFTEGLVSKDGITGTSTVVGTPGNTANTFTAVLIPGLTYYWRVKAVNAAGASGWSTVWSFRTKDTPTKPAAPKLTAPADKAEVSLTPTLAWLAAERATTYAVQVSKHDGFTEELITKDGVTGTSLLLASPASATVAATPLLAPGTTYYWRVKAVNAAGASEWSTVWSFKTKAETPMLPAVPKLYAPTDKLETMLIPTLAWYAAERATSYAVQIAKNDGFTEGLVSNDGITGTSTVVGTPGNTANTFTAVLTPGVIYYWRVKAVNGAGKSEWSTVWSFKTKAVTPALPAIPLLYAPADKAVDVSAIPTLAWQPAERATSYVLQVAKNDGFTDGLISKDGITGNTLVVGTAGTGATTLTPGTTYYWRVKAVNAAGASGWSTVWSFKTKAGMTTLPSIPKLTAPADKAVDVPVIPTLTWQAAERATTYALHIAKNDGFTEGVYSRDGITGTSLVVGTVGNVGNILTAILSPGTTYYWRMKAVNAAGKSEWSMVWSFKTKADILLPPTVPKLYYPSNNATGVSRTPTLGWNPAERAAKYTVQIAKNEGFTEGVITREGVTTNTLALTNQNTTPATALLAGSTKYYWRVKAMNAAGASGWSSIGNFTTVATAATTQLK